MQWSSRKSSNAVWHNIGREIRLPLYLGLLLHNKTRKCDLIDILFERGLSVSYDRILQLSMDIANAVIDQYEDDGVVCPTVLREGLFTTGNLDNLDHNPTSTSAQTAFNGTALSLTQHITNKTTGIERHQNRPLLSKETPKSKTIKPLMETYSQIPPATLPIDKPSPCKTTRKATSQSAKLHGVWWNADFLAQKGWPVVEERTARQRWQHFVVSSLCTSSVFHSLSTSNFWLDTTALW